MSKVYTSGYEDSLLRGREDPRPWSIGDVIEAECLASTRFLDVGCGTCSKTAHVAEGIHAFCGIDPSAEMLKLAGARLEQLGVGQFILCVGDASSLPYRDGSFDVAVSLLAPHSAGELSRVLAPSGIAVVEKIGERDKANLKEPFGMDNDGVPRGQFLMEEGRRLKSLVREFEASFDVVEARTGKWGTSLSPEGVLRLFQETGTIREFDERRDSQALEEVFALADSDGRIKTTQHRILLLARKGETR
ncbi:MAG: class I SAM-dependent methyltransferase [Myxococcota bacterium]